MALMMFHKICFHGEIWLIIPKLSLLPLLIWSTISKSVFPHCSLVYALACYRSRWLMCKKYEPLWDYIQGQHMFAIEKGLCTFMYHKIFIWNTKDHYPGHSVWQNSKLLYLFSHIGLFTIATVSQTLNCFFFYFYLFILNLLLKVCFKKISPVLKLFSSL